LVITLRIPLYVSRRAGSQTPVVITMYSITAAFASMPFKAKTDGAGMSLPKPYLKGRFHIYCNLDRENLPSSPRARFTLSHELGHYFIDEHQNNLASGQVRPHPSAAENALCSLRLRGASGWNYFSCVARRFVQQTHHR
jgi:hypothetical protein